jgi:hypothetical protein
MPDLETEELPETPCSEHSQNEKHEVITGQLHGQCKQRKKTNNPTFSLT